MKRGYIKVYRKIRDSFLWNEKPFNRIQAWLDLLMMANHQDTKFLFHGQMVHAKRGEVITSETKLSHRWQWARSKVSRFLKLIESEGMITRTPNTRSEHKMVKNVNIITICNYDTYQDVRTTNDTTNDTTNGHNEDTVEEIKEKNYIYSDFDFKKFVIHYNRIRPPTKIKSFNEKRKQKVLALLNNGFTKEHFLNVIYRLATMRRHDSYLYGNNKNNFRMDFDWLIEPENFQKVLEGTYGGEDRQDEIDRQREQEERRQKMIAEQNIREEKLQQERLELYRKNEPNNKLGDF